MSKKSRSGTKRRRSSRLDGSDPIASGSLVSGSNRFGRMFNRIVSGVFKGFTSSSLALSLPLGLLLLSTMTDYLVLLKTGEDASVLLFFSAMPVQVEDAKRVDAESIQKTIQAVIYLAVFFMCLINGRSVVNYLKKVPHILVIFALLLCTAIYSLEPTKVLTNTVLISLSFLMPLLFIIGQRDNEKLLVNFYWVLLLPFLVSQAASLAMLFFYGLDPVTLLQSTQRYGGFSGNPNSLGNAATLGIWLGFSILLTRQTSFFFKSVALISIVIFAINIGLSGSGTALASAIIVVALLVWMRVISSFHARIRGMVNAVAAAILVILALSIVVLVTPAQIFLAFTDSMGKDATLTGRTELWDIAKSAIAERPWFGWSYDSHTSVKAEATYFVKHNHYHNGFLDTLVAGGYALLLLVLYNVIYFGRAFFYSFRRDDRLFALVVPGIMIIVLNLSEYSLLRPLSEIWQLYAACFVLLTYGGVTATQRAGAGIQARKRVKSKSRRKKMRWA